MNKDNDLISIIVTVYKSYNYLNDLIKSVESQTHKNYELIFINDGSDKKVTKFLEGYDFGFFILERLSTEVRKSWSF